MSPTTKNQPLEISGCGNEAQACYENKGRVSTPQPWQIVDQFEGGAGLCAAGEQSVEEMMCGTQPSSPVGLICSPCTDVRLHRKAWIKLRALSSLFEMKSVGTDGCLSVLAFEKRHRRAEQDEAIVAVCPIPKLCSTGCCGRFPRTVRPPWIFACSPPEERQLRRRRRDRLLEVSMFTS